MAEKNIPKLKPVKVYYNPEMEDQPIQEPTSYGLVLGTPQSLEDINRAEGSRLNSAVVSDDLGAMAFEDLVEAAKLGETIIDGGYLKTSLVDVEDIFSKNITATGTITGAKIRTSSSGRRVELETAGDYANHITVYGSDGMLGLNIYDDAVFGGWSNSSINFDSNYGLRIGFLTPSSNQGWVWFSRNANGNSGAAAPEIGGVPSLKINATSINLGGTTRTSWPSDGISSLSELSINTTKNWGSYGISGLGTITPSSNISYDLGSASRYWDIAYIRMLEFCSYTSGNPSYYTYGDMWHTHISGGAQNFRGYPSSAWGAVASFDMTAV